MKKAVVLFFATLTLALTASVAMADSFIPEKNSMFMTYGDFFSDATISHKHYVNSEDTWYNFTAQAASLATFTDKETGISYIGVHQDSRYDTTLNFGPGQDYNNPNGAGLASGNYDGYDVFKALISHLYPKALEDSRYATVLQVAVWEHREAGMDGGEQEFNLHSGFFQLEGVNSSNPALTLDWLIDEANSAYIWAVANKDSVNDVELFYAGNILAFDYAPVATPIPGVVLLFGTGLAGLGIVRKRFSN